MSSNSLGILFDQSPLDAAETAFSGAGAEVFVEAPSYSSMFNIPARGHSTSVSVGFVPSAKRDFAL